MKLIIDISEVVKHKIYAYGLSLSPSDKEQLINAIMNGIPLEQISDEIRQIVDEETEHDENWARGLQYSLCIIDKYKAESEE